MGGLSNSYVAALCAVSAAAGAAAAAAVLLLRQQQQQQQQRKQQDVSEHCPGPESRMAGLSAGCEGCPSRSLCLAAKGGTAATGAATAGEAAAEKEPKNAEVAEKLRGVRKKIIVLSGKGGVGKSTVTSQLGQTHGLGFRV